MNSRNVGSPFHLQSGKAGVEGDLATVVDSTGHEWRGEVGGGPLDKWLHDIVMMVRRSVVKWPFSNSTLSELLCLRMCLHRSFFDRKILTVVTMTLMTTMNVMKTHAVGIADALGKILRNGILNQWILMKKLGCLQVDKLDRFVRYLILKLQ